MGWSVRESDKGSATSFHRRACLDLDDRRLALCDFPQSIANAPDPWNRSASSRWWNCGFVDYPHQPESLGQRWLHRSVWNCCPQRRRHGQSYQLAAEAAEEHGGSGTKWWRRSALPSAYYRARPEPRV